MGKIARAEIQAYLEAMAQVAGLKIANDEKDSGLHLDYLAPNGWLVVEQRSGNDMFHPVRLRGPALIQNLHYAKRVIEHCKDDNAIPIGLKPASMFDAQVLAAVRRLLIEIDRRMMLVDDMKVTLEDIRLLRGWTGR